MVIVTVAEDVAAFEITNVVAFVMETTVVKAGILDPVIDCPTPIRAVEATVIVVVAFVVADSVKTPTGATLDPVVEPNKTRVLTVLSIVPKFCPGWAIMFSAPVPSASKVASNCHKLFGFEVKPESVKSTTPDPIPAWSIVIDCKPSAYPL
jgi:hypothetical protein